MRNSGETHVCLFNVAVVCYLNCDGQICGDRRCVMVHTVMGTPVAVWMVRKSILWRVDLSMG